MFVAQMGQRNGQETKVFFFLFASARWIRVVRLAYSVRHAVASPGHLLCGWRGEWKYAISHRNLDHLEKKNEIYLMQDLLKLLWFLLNLLRNHQSNLFARQLACPAAGTCRHGPDRARNYIKQVEGLLNWCWVKTQHSKIRTSSVMQRTISE